MKSLILLSIILSALASHAVILRDISSEASATQTHSHSSGNFPATHANDGDLDTFNHTDSPRPGAALILTYPEERLLQEITIITRVNCCGGRLNGATLKLFDSSDTEIFEIPVIDAGAGELFVVPLPDNTTAQTIRIGFEPTQNGIVHLAEVIVNEQIGGPPSIDTFTATPQGASTLIEWSTTDADTVHLSDFGPVPTTGQQLITPTESKVYLLSAVNECDTTVKSIAVEVTGQPLGLIISEFVANDPGDPDWVEIWNPSNSPISLLDHYLTDDPSQLQKFALPNITLEPGEFHVTDDPFGLAREADSYIALINQNNQIISSYTYPEQFPGSSYGINLNNQATYFTEPSRGGFNTTPTTLGFLKVPTFSKKRGFYTTPFTLQLSNQNNGSQIFYTLDGSEPTAETGQLYTTPLTISTTSVVRAIEHIDGYVSSLIKANTYIFPAQVVNQSATPPTGYPLDWQPSGTTGLTAPIPATSDYEMDPRVALGGPYTDSNNEPFTTEDALRDLPTMCISFPIESWFDLDVGIHANAAKRGTNWERQASLEYFDSTTGKDFETGIGLRIHGGRARVPEALKKSFRVYFRSRYGDSKLNNEIFDSSPKEGFDHLVLRGGTGKSWMAPYRDEDSHLRTTYLRDEFYRRSFHDMGHLSLYGNFVHLYINGLYWGLYNPCERPGADMPANHSDSDRDDYDVIKLANTNLSAADGTIDRWVDTLALASSTPLTDSTYETLSEQVDLDNLIDYMIVNFYIGNQDWVTNNGYCYSRRTGPDTKWRFLPWDGEASFLNISRNSTTDGRDKTIAPLGLHDNLRRHPEYRLRFADRIHKHLLDEDATLGQAASTARMNALAFEVDRAIVGESARWGDLNRPSLPYSREGNWLQELNLQRSTYLTQRPSITFTHLQQDNLFPNTLPPSASLIPTDNRLVITSPNFQSGTIYFTTDGSDPRLIGGSLSGSAQVYQQNSTTNNLVSSGFSQWRYLDTATNLGPSDQPFSGSWHDPNFDDSSWSSGPGPLGNGSIQGVTLNTLIDIGPSDNRHRTTYFRHEFSIGDLADATSASVSVLFDDGIILSINGTEIFRSSNVPIGQINFNTLTPPSIGGADEGNYDTINIPITLLNEGVNIITAEVHQATTGSSDLGFDAIVSIQQDSGSTNSITLTGDTLIKTRFRNTNGEWSALEEEFFELADLENSLVITKLMYDPAPLTQDDINAGFNSNKDFEFMELMNVGNVSIRLAGIRLTKGVDYDFPDNVVINPDERIVIANNDEGYAHRYGAIGISLLDEWEKGDSLNNGGERIKLVDRNTETIREFSYDDIAPWPTNVQKTGFAMVLRNPSRLPDHSLPWNWRSSTNIGGSPGINDALTYDGFSNFSEFAFGSDKPISLITLLDDGSYRLGTEFNLAAEGIQMTLYTSTNLSNWVEVTDSNTPGIQRLPDGRNILTLDHFPGSDSSHRFYQFKVELVD